MQITNVTLMEHLQGELDLCRLEFDGGADSAYIVWNHTNLLEYVGGQAVVTFRQDFYKGTIAKFVNTLAKVGVIKTLEREDNIKLYSPVADNHSTVCFKDIKEGQTIQRVTVYVVRADQDSSSRATWANFLVMDKERKIAVLRLFNPSTEDFNYRGRYILCDIRRNKYGLSTDTVTTIDTSFALSPEVTIAEKYVMDAFAGDSETLGVIQQSNFISFCKSYVAEEPGFDIVRLAIELDICNEMANLVQDTNFDFVRKALLYSHFTVLNSESVYKPEIVGFATISKFRFQDRKTVLNLLHSDTEELKNERAAYNAIKGLADNAVKIKKGLV